MIFRRTIGLRDLVAERTEDGVLIHLPSMTGLDYDTFCGADITVNMEAGPCDEPDHPPVPLPRGARVTCTRCIEQWYAAKTIPGSWMDAKALASITLGVQS